MLIISYILKRRMKRSSEPELNPMGRWNGGILGVESEESAPFGSGALALWSRFAATPRGKLEDR
jgi:hypothetical protein